MYSKILLLATLIFITSCTKESKKQTKIDFPDGPVFIHLEGVIGTYDNSSILPSDGYILVCGDLADSLTLFKVGNIGHTIWRSNIYCGEQSHASAITESSDNSIFICGSTDRNWQTSKKDVLLVKTNSIGDTLWSKTYGGEEVDYAVNIIFTSDGNILISGVTGSFGADLFGDLYLIKVNTDGDVIWSKTFYNQNQERGYGLIETQAGEYLITGKNNDLGDDQGMYFLKVSEEGEKLWDRTIDSGSQSIGYTSLETENGEIITCGASNGDVSQVMVVKSDANGDVIWKKYYGDHFRSEIGFSIKENYNDTYSITGSINNPADFSTQILLLNIDDNGNEVWLKNYGYGLSGRNLIVDDDFKHHVLGGNNFENMFISYFDKDGVYIPWR